MIDYKCIASSLRTIDHIQHSEHTLFCAWPIVAMNVWCEDIGARQNMAGCPVAGHTCVSGYSGYGDASAIKQTYVWLAASHIAHRAVW
jgi:hypothetical protein